jgi:hypothetical protein
MAVMVLASFVDPFGRGVIHAAQGNVNGLSKTIA